MLHSYVANVTASPPPGSAAELDEEQLRILQLVQKPQRRGAEIFAFELNRQLETLGCETSTLYLYDYQGAEALPLGERDHRLDGVADHYLERVLGFHPLLLRSLSWHVERFSPDIIQLNGARTVKYGAALKRLPRNHLAAKLVYRIIDIPSFWNRERWKIQIFQRLIIPSIDGIVGVSERSLADARCLYSFRAPGCVILNGIDGAKLRIQTDRSTFRRKHGVAEQDIVLLFLNSLVPQKRPDRFVRVFSTVRKRHPNVRAWIVGDGALRGETEMLTRKLGLERECLFFGYKSDVGTFINAADMMVLTSDTEGSPAVALEAGYLGRPVVATDVGGISESIVHGHTGLLVNGDSEVELSRAILRLIAQPGLRRDMGQKACERIRSHFTIERVAECYLNFYRALLRGTARTLPTHLSLSIS